MSTPVGVAAPVVKVLVPLPLLPAASPWVTWAVYWVLAVSVGLGVTDHALPVRLTLVNVCTGVPVAVGPV